MPGLAGGHQRPPCEAPTSKTSSASATRSWRSTWKRAGDRPPQRLALPVHPLRAEGRDLITRVTGPAPTLDADLEARLGFCRHVMGEETCLIGTIPLAAPHCVACAKCASRSPGRLDRGSPRRMAEPTQGGELGGQLQLHPQGQSLADQTAGPYPHIEFVLPGIPSELPITAACAEILRLAEENQRLTEEASFLCHQGALDEANEIVGEMSIAPGAVLAGETLLPCGDKDGRCPGHLGVAASAAYRALSMRGRPSRRATGRRRSGSFELEGRCAGLNRQAADAQKEVQANDDIGRLVVEMIETIAPYRREGEHHNDTLRRIIRERQELTNLKNLHRAVFKPLEAEQRDGENLEDTLARIIRDSAFMARNYTNAIRGPETEVARVLLLSDLRSAEGSRGRSRVREPLQVLRACREGRGDPGAAKGAQNRCRAVGRSRGTFGARRDLRERGLHEGLRGALPGCCCRAGLPLGTALRRERPPERRTGRQAPGPARQRGAAGGLGEGALPARAWMGRSSRSSAQALALAAGARQPFRPPGRGWRTGSILFIRPASRRWTCATPSLPSGRRASGQHARDRPEELPADQLPRLQLSGPR